ncbi:hypothetical protein [Rhizobium sp. FKL33]|uniref:hypothetical protein n=1 Tax=Rhizobium sp. FKL33 TaxID=2562307 RepID=UPI0010C12F2A|nr:hypothetical protein [Rhizobium sp. FKL33]
MQRCFSNSILALLLCSGTAQASDAVRVTDREAYLNIRKLVFEKIASLPPKESPINKLVIEPGHKIDGIELLPCGGVAEFWGISEATYDLVEIAGLMGEWADSLRTVGYPEDAYLPALNIVEQRYLERAEVKPLLDFDDFEKFADDQVRFVVSSIKKWRKRENSSLPQVDATDDCGAGGALPVEFRPDPPGGQIFVITEFEYELCALNNGDPTDRSKCRFWRQAKSSEYVAGWNYVQGEWASGLLKPSRMNFDDVSPGQIIMVRLHDGK